MIIQLWKSPDKKTTYSFNGDTSGEVVMKQHINTDDNINMFIKKLFVYLYKYHKAQSENHLYFWIEEPVIPDTWLLVNFINNVFKSNQRIEKSTLVTAINNYFATQHKCQINALVDKNDALKYMRNIKDTLIKRVEPLLFKYTSNGFMSFVQYNPLTTSADNIQQDVESLSISTYESSTLDSFKVSKNSVINLIAASNFPAQTKAYFPFIDQKTETYEKLKDFITSIDKIEHDVVNNKHAPEYKNDSDVTYLQVKFNETNFNPNVDLKYIFDDLKLSEVVPFVKYRAKVNIYYKLFKPSLTYLEEHLPNWTDKLSTSSILKNYSQSNLVYKIKYNEYIYITLVLYEDLSYELKFNFGMKYKENIDNVFKFTSRVVNGVLKEIQSMYKSFYIPLVSDNFLSSPEVRLIQFVTSNSVSLEKQKIKYENLKGMVESNMFSYFSVINNPDKSILHLQYKKVDNYTKYDNIQAFITNNYTSDREAMIERITKTFTIPQEAADKEYDKWAMVNEVELVNDKGKMYVKPKNAGNFINIKVKLNPSTVDVKYITYGVKTVEMQEKISFLINVLLDISKKKASETTIGQEEYDKIVHNVNLLESNSNNENINFKDLESLQDTGLNSMMDFELDEDLLALEKEFLLQNTQDIDNTNTIPKNSGVDEPKKLAPTKQGKQTGFLADLYRADSDLFQYTPLPGTKRKDYASVCQWTARQQPVILSEKEYANIKKKFPDALDGFVKSGSNDDLKNKNFYVCPKIWCPISRLAMSYDDYIKNDKKCPDPSIDEDPILMQSKFWGDDEKALQRPHYPGFLDRPSHHPKQLCLPCCYKLNGDQNKKRIRDCMGQPEKDSKDNEEAPKTNKEDDMVGNEKYIKNADYFPLDNMRYGLLPEPLAKMFGNKTCGTYANGTGLINDKTDCFVRKGISQKTQSFLTCIAPLLENKKIKDASSLISIISKTLTVDQYIGLENGKLLRLFINKTANIFDKAQYIEFKEWFLKQDQYNRTFKLNDVQSQLEQTSRFSKTEMSGYKEVLREFIIYNSMKSFIAYLNDANIQKDHRTLLDLIATDVDNINIYNYNFIIIEIDNERKKYYIECPFNRSTNAFVDMNKPFIFIVKVGKFYEQLVHIANSSKNTSYKFPLKYSPDVTNIIQFYYQNCSYKNNILEENVINTLEKTGNKVKYIVIDYSYRVKGVVVKDNLYVPFKIPMDILSIPFRYKIIYISDVVKVKCKLSKEAIKKVYMSLEEMTGDKFYNIKTYVIIDDKIGGITLNDNTFVPIDVSSKNILYKTFGNDLDIFLNVEAEDIRTSLMKTVEQDEKIFQELYMTTFEKINADTDHKQELEFLLDPKNPFPMSFKRQKLLHMLKKVSSKFDTKYLDKLSEMFVKNRDLNFYMLKHKFKVHDNEVFLDYADILNNKLQNIIEYQRDPYKTLTERLDTLLESYVYDHEEFTQETFEGIINFGNLSTLPYVWRSILKSYQLLKYGDNYEHYDSQYLYRLFSKLSAVINPKKHIVEEDLRAMVRTHIIYDYELGSEEYLEDLFGNESFTATKKTLKINKNSKSIEDILTVFDSIYYFPSEYEIDIMARMLGVSIIITKRKSGKNETVRVINVKKNKNRYIIFNQAHNRFQPCEVFEIYTLNNNVLLHKEDIPADFWNKLSPSTNA